MTEPQGTRLNIRPIALTDYPQLADIMAKVYPDLGGAWSEDTIAKLIRLFPEGQIAIVDHDKVVAVALTLCVKYDKYSIPHRYNEVINESRIPGHNAKGDALYGLDVFVDPNYRGARLGRRLYEARKELCRDLNLRAILAGGRLPGYHKVADQMQVTEYIEAVGRKSIHDPILSFQLSNDFTVKRLMRGYLPEDTNSAGFATLLEWDNIFYERDDNSIAYETIKSQVRVGVVQWQMQKTHSVDDLLNQVEFFVDAMSDYRSDFALFPEFFSAPLMGLAPDLSAVEAMRFLAGFTKEICYRMSQMAVSYNINIIAGSLPLIDNDEVYNVAYLCRRDGSVEEQRKIHITPSERRDWVISGGDHIQTFETDAGRVGILICYDVEFPELGRILAEQKLDILFVPFWTDTKNGYLRVRHCAQARAIENECYVVIGGSCGNLSRVDNVDIQYAQSAVFTPSDLFFPHDAIQSEAVANSEQLLFADLDIDKLQQLHFEGSVNNLRDRRHDLYRLRWFDDAE